MLRGTKMLNPCVCVSMVSKITGYNYGQKAETLEYTESINLPNLWVEAEISLQLYFCFIPLTVMNLIACVILILL